LKPRLARSGEASAAEAAGWLGLGRELVEQRE